MKLITDILEYRFLAITRFTGVTDTIILKALIFEAFWSPLIRLVYHQLHF